MSLVFDFMETDLEVSLSQKIHLIGDVTGINRPFLSLPGYSKRHEYNINSCSHKELHTDDITRTGVSSFKLDTSQSKLPGVISAIFICYSSHTILLNITPAL